jgi:hypothetical protein
MEKDEFAKLLAILKKINEIVNNAYTSNQSCIISTYSQPYLEIGLSIYYEGTKVTSSSLCEGFSPSSSLDEKNIF